MLVICFAYSLVFQWWMTFFYANKYRGTFSANDSVDIYKMIVLVWYLLYFPFSEKIVLEMASTPTWGRLLRSSSKTTTPTRIPVHAGSPASVLKKSSKTKVDKMSGTNSKEGEEEFVKLDGIVPLNVRITLHFVYWN